MPESEALGTDRAKLTRGEFSLYLRGRSSIESAPPYVAMPLISTAGVLQLPYEGLRYLSSSLQSSGFISPTGISPSPFRFVRLWRLQCAS